MTKFNFFNFLFLISLCYSITAHWKFILTGGPGTGKTTVIEKLQEYGFQVAPESYCLLYNQFKKNNQQKEMFADPVKLYNLLMAKQCELESSLDQTKPAFLDRSTYDIIFFGNYFKVPMPQELMDEPKKRTYDLVFFLNPLPELFYQQTEMRQEDRATSLNIDQFIKEKYKQAGFTCIEVPFDTTEKRVAFILDTIKNLYFDHEYIF